MCRPGTGLKKHAIITNQGIGTRHGDAGPFAAYALAASRAAFANQTGNRLGTYPSYDPEADTEEGRLYDSQSTSTYVSTT